MRVEETFDSVQPTYDGLHLHRWIDCDMNNQPHSFCEYSITLCAAETAEGTVDAVHLSIE